MSRGPLLKHGRACDLINMRCVYINLAGATERRRNIEASFAAARPPAGWTLERFEALSPATAPPLPGRLSPAGKASFASHAAVLRESLAHHGPVLVLEDDAIFSPRMFAAVEAALTAPAAWDLILTDAIIGDPHSLMRLARARPGLIAQQRIEEIDLARVLFAGATAYVVSAAAKPKLAELLTDPPAVDVFYDLILRRFVHGGALKACVTFPFVTSIGPDADVSQLQLDRHRVSEFLGNTFRRLMYVDRNLAACQADVRRIREEICDEEGLMIGTVLAGFLSDRFVQK